jgi:molybdenum cofactor guanylyltransferase
MAASAEVSALILAGGQSSRMGRDKALLEVQEQFSNGNGSVPLIRRVYDVAAQGCGTVYVVAKQLDHYKPLLPSNCRWFQEPDNEFPGPLVGFEQVCDRIPSAWTLLLACDLPFLDAKILNHWIQNAITITSPPVAFVPFHNHRWEPLCALYHQSCRASLHTFVHQGGKSFQAWLNQQPIQPLILNDPKMLSNCNTPEDWDYLAAED